MCTHVCLSMYVPMYVCLLEYTCLYACICMCRFDYETECEWMRMLAGICFGILFSSSAASLWTGRNVKLSRGWRMAVGWFLIDSVQDVKMKDLPAVALIPKALLEPPPPPRPPPSPPPTLPYENVHLNFNFRFESKYIYAFRKIQTCYIGTHSNYHIQLLSSCEQKIIIIWFLHYVTP